MVDAFAAQYSMYQDALKKNKKTKKTKKKKKQKKKKKKKKKKTYRRTEWVEYIDQVNQAAFVNPAPCRLGFGFLVSMFGLLKLIKGTKGVQMQLVTTSIHKLVEYSTTN